LQQTSAPLSDPLIRTNSEVKHETYKPKKDIKEIIIITNKVVMMMMMRMLIDDGDDDSCNHDANVSENIKNNNNLILNILVGLVSLIFPP